MAANKLFEINGKLEARPEREDYKSEGKYRRALAAFDEKVRRAGSKAFDEGFRKSIKGKAKKDDDFKREKPAPGSAADEERKRKVAEMRSRRSRRRPPRSRARRASRPRPATSRRRTP